MLYNKTRVLQFEEDDSPMTVFTEVYPLFKGGVASNGQVSPGLRFTDGCGHSRSYTGAVAINGHNTYNNSVWLDPGSGHDASKLLWSQAQELLDNGWDIENHSDLHTLSSPTPAQQLSNLDALISSRLRGYQPSVHIVPTNFTGYPTAAFAAGYVAVSSASQADNFAMVNAYQDTRMLLSSLPVPPARFVYRRYSADASTGESNQVQLNRLKALSDNLMAPGATAAEVYLQRVFAHSIDFNVLSGWMNYTQSIAQDRLWVTTLREFEEYRRVSSQVVKAEALNGNTLTIDLNYAGVGPNTRFQNLTLLVDSPGTITGIAVTGADSSSVNPSTKLVNVFRHQPRTAPGALPVQLTAFTARREAVGVRLAWHTASEVQASHFQVQRSADGQAFAPVGTVAASGTSAVSHAYAFVDALAPAGTSWYYRLAQLDTDGTRNYSPVVLVAAASVVPGAQVRVAPNPAQAFDALTVTVDGCASQARQLQLLDAVGRVVLARPVQPSAAEQVLSLSLPSGIGAGAYTLRVVGGPQPLQTRVLLTR